LHSEGVVIDYHTDKCKFSIIRILGDAPARCMFLNTAYYTAFGHCVYSDVHGERLYDRNHFYEYELAQERTTEEFYSLEYMGTLQ